LGSAFAWGARVEQEPYGELAYRREVGVRIRTERYWLNLRQEELAARAGVSRHFISAVERGRHGLDAWRLRKVARALGRDLGWLLDEIPEHRR
jgi:transcriptional regulator with XRE-family HTH domain